MSIYHNAFNKAWCSNCSKSCDIACKRINSADHEFVDHEEVLRRGMNGQAGRALELRRNARAIDGTISAAARERRDVALPADAADAMVVRVCDEDDTCAVHGDASRLTESRSRSPAVFIAAQRRAREPRDDTLAIDHADTIRLRISHV